MLRAIYHNPKDPGSYGGVDKLWRSAKRRIPNLKRKDVEKFLRSDDSYTLHRQYRVRYPRNRIFVSRMDQQWEADLVDMKKYSEENDDIHYILTVVDVLSKYAWAVPVKRKNAETMIGAFKLLLKKAKPRKPEKLHTDEGKEFTSVDVEDFLNAQDIQRFSTHSDTKAAIAERFNRTLNGLMNRYFTAEKTNRWVDVLDDLLENYNNAEHSTIKKAPVEVTKETELEIWKRMYGRGKKLDKGQYVRISRKRLTFDKGYRPGWSLEVFRVNKRSDKADDNVPTYRIKDLMEEDIKGQFYTQELQPITFDPKEYEYRIERVVRTSTDRKTGLKTHLVKWLVYPEKFNSWVNDGDIRRFAK